MARKEKKTRPSIEQSQIIPLSLRWIPDYHRISRDKRPLRSSNWVAWHAYGSLTHHRWVTWHTYGSLRHSRWVSRRGCLEPPALSRCWLGGAPVRWRWFRQGGLPSEEPVEAIAINFHLVAVESTAKLAKCKFRTSCLLVRDTCHRRTLKKCATSEKIWCRRETMHKTTISDSYICDISSVLLFHLFSLRSRRFDKYSII